MGTKMPIFLRQVDFFYRLKQIKISLLFLVIAQLNFIIWNSYNSPAFCYDQKEKWKTPKDKNKRGNDFFPDGTAS